MPEKKAVLAYRGFAGALRDLLAQFPTGACLLASAAVAATLIPRLGRTLIDLRGGDARFEPWRPITGHLVHGNWLHLALNLLVFVPLAALRERRVGLARLACEYAALSLGVAAGVRLLHGEWSTYCGLSGIVYGLLCLVVLDPRPGLGSRSRAGAAVLAALAVKTALEAAGSGWLVGRGVLEASLGVVYLAGAHSSGMAAGLLIAAAHAMLAGAPRASLGLVTK